MKKFKAFILGFLFMLPCVFAIAGCGDTPASLNGVTAIVNNGNMTIYEHQDYKIESMLVYALYTDGSKKAVPNTEYTIIDNTKNDNPEIVIKYKDKQVKIALHEEKVSSISFSKSKLVVKCGEEVDYSNISLSVKYNNNHEENIVIDKNNITITDTESQNIKNLTYNYFGIKDTIKLEILPIFVTMNKGEDLNTMQPFELVQYDSVLGDNNNAYDLTALKEYYNLAITYDNKNFIQEGIVFPPILYKDVFGGLQNVNPYYSTSSGAKVINPLKVNIVTIEDFNLIRNDNPLYVGSSFDLIDYFTLEITFKKWDLKKNNFVVETKSCLLDDYFANMEFNGLAENAGDNTLNVSFTLCNGIQPIVKDFHYTAIRARIAGIVLSQTVSLIQYQNFDFSEIEFNYIYEDESKLPEIIDPTKLSFSIPTVDTSVAGNISITVTCEDSEVWVDGVSKSLTFNIEVVELTSISANLCEGISISAGSEITADLFDIMANDTEYIYDYENVIVTPNVANVESGQTLEIEISYHGIKTTVSVVVK